MELVILEIKDASNCKHKFYVPKPFYEVLKEHQKKSMTWLVT